MIVVQKFKFKMFRSQAPLLPQNQRPHLHPALVTDPASVSNHYQVNAQNPDRFSLLSGFCLAILIILVLSILVFVSRKSIAKYYNFFHFGNQIKELQIQPIRTHSGALNKPTKFETFSFAIKAQKSYQVYIFELVCSVMIIVVFASCLSMAIQWNNCLTRTNQNFSFKCLNQQDKKLKDPYVGGVVVGALIFCFQLAYNSFSWKVFRRYAEKFKTEPSKLQSLQLDLLQKIESDLDKQSVTTMPASQSDKNALIGLMAEKEIPPIIKKFKDLQELVQIDEDENDEHCSPVKPRQKNVSPVKRFKPNDSIRSEEHISPTKGAIQFHQIDGNESADDGELVIRAQKMESLDELSKSVQSLHFSEANGSKKEKENITENEKNKIPQKLRTVIVLTFAASGFLLLTSLIMISLYFYANSTQDGIKIMLKSVGVAIATDFLLFLPLFVKNYSAAKNFLNQESDKLQVIFNFWQTYRSSSSLIFQAKVDNEANNGDMLIQNYQVKIGDILIDYQLPATLAVDETKQQNNIQIPQHDNIGSAQKQNSNKFFSPKSPSPNREVVPLSGSVSCLGEALPSARSLEKNKTLKFSQNNLDEHSDPSIEEIGQSPGKKESPQKQNQRLTSIKKSIFSSTKKNQQFETPKLSGNQLSSKKHLIPEAQLPTFNLPEGGLASKQSEDILSIVLSPTRLEIKKINEIKKESSVFNQPARSESSETRSPLEGFKKFGQRAGEEVRNIFRNISKSGLGMINKKGGKDKKIDLSDSKIESQKDLNNDDEQIQYSPMWSSVKRETKSQLMKYRPGKEETKIEVEEVLSNNLPSLKQLHTINQKSEEESPQAISKRLAYADIQNADKADKSGGRSYKKRKFNSPNSLQRSFREATGERIGEQQLSQGGSQSKLAGEHTTARKRRLMMIDDAAGSSINFKNNSIGVTGTGNIAQNSVMRDTRQIQYQSLGSEQFLRKSDSNGLLSGNQVVEKNDSQVRIGSGNVEENEETFQNLLSNPYQDHEQLNQQPAQKMPALNLSSERSVPQRQLQGNKSKKVFVLKADSEVDSSSVNQNSALNNYQTSERSNTISPGGNKVSAFDKLVQISKQVVNTTKHVKGRSLSLNQTSTITQLNKNLPQDVNQIKPQTKEQPEARRASEPHHQQQTLNTISGLKSLDQKQKLFNSNQQNAVALNKISIQQFKTQQEQRGDQKDTINREQVSKKNSKEQSNYNSIGGQVAKLNVGSRFTSRQGVLTQKENKPTSSRQTSRDRQQLKSQPPPGSKYTDKRININSASSAEEYIDNQTVLQEKTNTSESNFQVIDYEKLTEEELEKLRKLQQINQEQHLQDQRRRLEHFLSVARQAHAKQDVLKIKVLLNELLESGKCLPAQRINELKNLDIMTSPYNQTLLSMLRVENAQQKQFKELQNQQQMLKGKYSLPKASASFGGDSLTGFRPSQDKLRELRKLSVVDTITNDQQRFRSKRQSDSAERSASSLERAMLANAGSQILEGDHNSSRSYGQRQTSIAPDVYQINTKLEPLQKNEYSFVQPKSVLNQSKPVFITFENLNHTKDSSTINKAQNSPSSNYQIY